METIRDKLILTANKRFKVIQNDEVDLLEEFPYFFYRPELVWLCAFSFSIVRNTHYLYIFSCFQVLLDFTHYVPHYVANTFEQNWVRAKDTIQREFSTHKSSNDFLTEFSSEVEPFLMLLKLFPLQANKRQSALRLPFIKAVDKFVVFCKVYKENSEKPQF